MRRVIQFATRLIQFRKLVPMVITGVILLTALKYIASGASPNFGRVQWFSFVSALLASLVANNVICGLRWRLFLTGVSPSEAVRRYSEGAFLNTVLPFGGDAYRAWSGRIQLDSVVTDRILGAVVVASLAAISGAVLNISGSWTWVALIVLLAGGATWFAVGRRILSLPRGVGPAQVFSAVIMTIAYISVAAVAVRFLFQSAGIELGLGAAVVLSPLVMAAAAIPSVAGIGPGLAVLAWSATSHGGSSVEVATLIALIVAIQFALVVGGGISMLIRWVPAKTQAAAG